jgi:hypothetical protein
MVQRRAALCQPMWRIKGRQSQMSTHSWASNSAGTLHVAEVRASVRNRLVRWDRLRCGGSWKMRKGEASRHGCYMTLSAEGHANQDPHENWTQGQDAANLGEVEAACFV